MLRLLTEIIYPDVGKFYSKMLVCISIEKGSATMFTSYDASESGHMCGRYCRGRNISNVARMSRS